MGKMRSNVVKSLLKEDGGIGPVRGTSVISWIEDAEFHNDFLRSIKSNAGV